MLNPSLLPELTEWIRREFHGRAPGHCLRIDHLERADALTLATSLNEGGTGFLCAVLSLAPTHKYEIRPDQAIEVRNRKDTGMCLIVPDELGQDAASSLSNSFALFDLQAFLRECRRKVFADLPETAQRQVRSVLGHLKGRAAVSVEDLIAFCIKVSEQPEPEWIGRYLWMVGLVPDLGGDFTARLGRNHAAVDAISRPPRPQSSAEDRVRSLRLTDPAFERKLVWHLGSRPLHEPENWQRPIAESDESLSFDKWPFPEISGARLTAITVEPFADKRGSVLSWCKLRQSEMGMPLEADVGERSKILVRWSSDPATPSGVGKWRADLVPSLTEYGDEVSAVIGSASVKPGRRSALLSLDIDLDETEYRALQVRICALDEIGAEVVDHSGNLICGYSEEFWLERSDEEPPLSRPRKRTDQSLPLARVRVALEVPNGTAAIEELSPQWTESAQDEACFFSLQLAGKAVVRIAISRILASIHAQCISNPKLAWFTAVAEADAPMKPDQVQPEPVPGEYLRGAFEDFLKQRDALMKELSRRGVRSKIESLEVDATIRDRARKYAKAYRELIADIQSRNAADELTWALRVDTLSMELHYAGELRQRATLVLPTHPLRLLWYVSYAELLDHFAAELLKTPRRERASSLTA